VIWVWIKRWALVAIGVPLLAKALDGAADRLEDSRGETSATRGMHGAAGTLRRWRDRRGRRGRGAAGRGRAGAGRR
jgi:hypothetical protein